MHRIRSVYVRSLISLVNLAGIAVAFVVLFEFPQYAQEAFYLLLGWIFVGFALMYLPGRNRPVGSGSTAGSARTDGPAATPLASGGTPGRASSLDFCIYCGTTLVSGSAVCAACGHAVPQG